MANISILGLGAMGQALTARFLHRGHTVTVWNHAEPPSETAEPEEKDEEGVPSEGDSVEGGAEKEPGPED